MNAPARLTFTNGLSVPANTGSTALAILRNRPHHAIAAAFAANDHALSVTPLTNGFMRGLLSMARLAVRRGDTAAARHYLARWALARAGSI